MKIIKKIYTILVLITNVIIRRRHYKLHFIGENIPPMKNWYYDFKHWGFDKHNLLMVCGADTLCELYADGKDDVTVDIVASKKDLGYGCRYDHYVAEESPSDFTFLDKIIYGRNYKEELDSFSKNQGQEARKFWICPVTLFVLGRYPKHIYIKKRHFYIP